MALPQISRRAFLSTAAGAGVAALGTAGYAALIEPFWIDVHEQPVTLPDFPPELDGVRIAHLTDIHFDLHTELGYADELARRIREEIKPDLVAFTGDLTTHRAELVAYGADWLKGLGIPTVACLGNHDYDPMTSARAGCPTDLADDLARRLEGSSVTLLRNAHTAVMLKGVPLHVAGVEDYYTGLLDPFVATAGIPEGAPRLMLCHNPDAAQIVDELTAGGLILAGHTHGGQVQLPFVGPILLPVMDREKVAGLFKLKRSSLYVSRGIGYLLRLRFLCRPELPVHRIVVPKR